MVLLGFVTIQFFRRWPRGTTVHYRRVLSEMVHVSEGASAGVPCAALYGSENWKPGMPVDNRPGKHPTGSQLNVSSGQCNVQQRLVPGDQRFSCRGKVGRGVDSYSLKIVMDCDLRGWRK